MQAETVGIDLMAMVEDSTMSADESNTSAGSFSEEPNSKLFDSPLSHQQVLFRVQLHQEGRR